MLFCVVLYFVAAETSGRDQIDIHADHASIVIQYVAPSFSKMIPPSWNV
jgi:hypothetical protein